MLSLRVSGILHKGAGSDLDVPTGYLNPYCCYIKRPTCDYNEPPHVSYPNAAKRKETGKNYLHIEMRAICMLQKWSACYCEYKVLPPAGGGGNQ